ncbi:hypothetical protein AB0383_20065 [Amycolatopsis sp. NPDC051373]|uniref:hypothetical protein n=1 Tax=Amycolatopsis sp. NPDC051373 TaxID=3155801 RepID=UPI0034510C38
MISIALPEIATVRTRGHLTLIRGGKREGTRTTAVDRQRGRARFTVYAAIANGETTVRLDEVASLLTQPAGFVPDEAA